MAKPTTSTHQPTVKPLTSRPLDLLYFSFFVLHFLSTILVDLLPLWPDAIRNMPVGKQLYAIGKGFTDPYIKKTNDPFMLAIWGLVEQPWHFLFQKIFMWMEIFIQMPTFVIGGIGLLRDSPRVYPLIMSYAATAIITTTTVLIVTANIPSASDPTLDRLSKFYAMTEEGRWTIMYPVSFYLAVPAIMWVDMMFRVGGLVKAGIRKIGSRNVNAEKKEL